MELHYILADAMLEIDVLEDYFLMLEEATITNVERGREKYKYGFIIYKYLCGKAHNEALPPCMDEEEKEFVEKELIELDNDSKDNNIRYRIRNVEQYGREYELDPYISETKIHSLLEQPMILYESILMMLLIRYENVISCIYRELLENFSDAYLKNKSIEYSKIISADSNIKKILEVFLEDEVDEFMRRPLKEWYDTFEQKHKVKFVFGEEFQEFKELYYRRNIFVHNQGIVNESFIKGVGDETRYKLGDRIRLDHDYIMRSFNITRIVIFETIFGLSKLCRDKEPLAQKMFAIGFEYMNNSKWDVSKYIFSSLMRFPGQSEADLFVDKVNYYISVKNEEGLDSVKDEIEKIDTSLMRNRLAIAKAALLDDFSTITSILENEINKGISVSEVKAWPLFIQYRESDEYNRFVEEHKDVFTVENYSKDDIECLSKQYYDLK